MADPNLSESAWQKAKQDAAGAYTTPAFWIGATLMGLLFAAAALVLSDGDSAVTQAGISVFFGVLAISATLAFVFVVQLVAAPVRQRNELRSSWSQPIKTVNVDLTLRDAHRKGNDLAKLLERKNGFSGRDRDSARDWADTAVALLAGNVPDEAVREFLATGSEESSFVRQLRQQVSALQKIIDGLG